MPSPASWTIDGNITWLGVSFPAKIKFNLKRTFRWKHFHLCLEEGIKMLDCFPFVLIPRDTSSNITRYKLDLDSCVCINYCQAQPSQDHLHVPDTSLCPWFLVNFFFHIKEWIAFGLALNVENGFHSWDCPLGEGNPIESSFTFVYFPLFIILEGKCHPSCPALVPSPALHGKSEFSCLRWPAGLANGEGPEHSVERGGEGGVMIGTQAPCSAAAPQARLGLVLAPAPFLTGSDVACSAAWPGSLVAPVFSTCPW